MNIKYVKIKIKDLFENFYEIEKDPEEPVLGYSKKLNIRPPYQREFVYDDKKQAAVINSVLRGLPIGMFYWMESEDVEGGYELLDGQQRTLSICHYCSGKYSINIDSQPFFWDNLTPDKQAKINNYEIAVYVCKGTQSEKIDWFRTINVSGEKLENQEILNAVYNGPWINDAKKFFSKRKCDAFTFAQLENTKIYFISGNPIRQQILEKVLQWYADSETTSKNKFSVEMIMARDQKKPSAVELVNYYKNVILWAKTNFNFECDELKNINWGFLYNRYKNVIFGDPEATKERVNELLIDDEVQKKDGIFWYMFDGDIRHLNLRQFPEEMRKKKYEEQNGICECCKQHFEFKEMHGDHITPWSKGGKTVYENLQMLCGHCNISKGNRK